MTIFGIHICMQEIQAFLLAIPFVGFCWLCLRNWLLGRKDNHPHDER